MTSRVIIVSFMSAALACIGRVAGSSFPQQPSTDDSVQEYCVSTEAFETKCLKNEVVVMTHAVYGRMRIGRCLANVSSKLLTAFGDDPTFLGCKVDILDLMDRKCSGRNQCEVRGTLDNDLKILKPCDEALKLYLEASYKCVAVVEQDRSCVIPVSSNPLHIMRSSTTKLSCGTKSQPWTLEAPAGQQINVSLLDFGQRAREPANQHHCQQYGYIVDKAANKNVSICGLNQERQNLVHSSQSNVLEIVFVESRSDFSDVQRILLGLQAIGCLDIIPPENAWLRRSNNEAVVGCYTSRQSWHLRCVGDLWIGVIGNCTEDLLNDDAKKEISVESQSIDQHEVIIMVSIVFIALVICFTVICTGAVCLKRHYALSARKQFHQLEESYRHWSTPSVQPLNKPRLGVEQSVRAE